LRRLILRADCSSEIGSGHLFRLIALSRMLEKQFEYCFVTNDLTYIPQEEKKRSGFSCIEVPNFKYCPPDKKKRGEEIFFDLDDILTGDEIVITDGYWFGSKYQKAIKDKGCILICIDDLMEHEFYADLIINHAPGIAPNNYFAQDYTRFALGLDFAILRPSFLQQAKEDIVRAPKSSMFICFGGSDFLNLTVPTLQAVLDTCSFEKINIITGLGYKHIDVLTEYVNNDDRIIWHRNLTEKDLLDVMLQSSVALVPSSGILYECLAVGCEVISGYYTNNQKNIYKGFLESGTIFGCDDFSLISFYLKKYLLERDNFYHPKVIDGLSGIRIAELINDLAN
jgi:UDP-2,4-diacetamido-2,4,6-trideoxy-beta-L-altropyranose hydrolase